MNAQAKPALSFASGFGQSDTHVLTLSDGRPNPAKMVGQPYNTVDGQQIIAMVKSPPSVPKDKAQWFIPSTYNGSDARAHEVQRKNGQFFWVAIDLDQNNLALTDVLGTVHTVLPDVRCIVYSSRSATEDNKKWRVLIPLMGFIPGADFSDTMVAFYDLLEEESAGTLIPDRALARPGQLIYLPNKGEYYEYRIHKGEPLALTPAHPIIRLREENRAKVEAAQAFARKERERRTIRPNETRNDIKPVDHFNQNNTVPDLLARYGYRQAGQSHHWRSPMQTSGSYATREYGEYWISLSASDAAAGIGRTTPQGHCHGDAFDLYVHHEKGGDFNAAVRDYADEARLHARPEVQPAADQHTGDSKPDDALADPKEQIPPDNALVSEEEEPAPPKSEWPFKVNKAGVWKRSERMDKETGRIVTKWAPICSELRVLAETRDADGEEWGRLLEVVDRDGRRKRWAMPMSLMSGDGSAIRERLFSLGLVPSQAREARQALLEYIGSAQPEEKVRCVARIGWSGGAFVLPSQTIGVF
ncbi:DUF927 domain-containing protein [Paracoccus sp. IB05]|uniref:DUF927 domain-containing protein n=1 Tax=Paracoccus sp. IB05 TaxID=2779367 RepID=UPI0018E7FBC8|nr:DUF927 domain-containing protein [Paracoccus sp. IB05]MBJ2153865.1 DUF927 domain-containing protein [Paracoccus sp. IB05]